MAERSRRFNYSQSFTPQEGEAWDWQYTPPPPTRLRPGGQRRKFDSQPDMTPPPASFTPHIRQTLEQSFSPSQHSPKENHPMYSHLHRKTRSHPISRRPELTQEQRAEAANIVDIFNAHPKRIRSIEDTEKIADPIERSYAAFLLEHNPNLIIVHEPLTINVTRVKGERKPQVKRTGTLPDFYIHNPKSKTPEVPIFIDVTQSELYIRDPKSGQRSVMEYALPGARYVTLYWHNLRNIQAAHQDSFMLPQRQKFRKE